MAERTSTDQSQVPPCPACRATLDDAAIEKAHLCNKCLALHHEACWSGVCGACGARPSAIVALPEKRKPSRRTGGRAPWETLKLVAAVAWLLSFVVANLALVVAWNAGWALNPFKGMPVILELLLAPYQITALALVVITTVDSVLRGIARERGTGWPILIALLGFCTGGVSSFAYYLGWGRNPISDPQGES